MQHWTLNVLDWALFNTPLVDEALNKRCGVAQGCAH
jgi:hypothetical protein